MQIFKTIFCAALLCLITSTASYAATICDVDTIHCDYITGLKPDLANGRYIKINYKNRQSIDCLTGNGAYEIPNEEGKIYLGKNIYKFSICTDKTGSDCQLIAIDTFSVNKIGANQYQATPAGFAIDLSAVQSQFPACIVFSPKQKIGN